jgi:hypothetical protein
MTENLETVRNFSIRTFIRTKETAMGLPRMQRNTMCSPRFCFTCEEKKNNSVIFFKKIHRRLWIFIVLPSRCPSSHQGG